MHDQIKKGREEFGWEIGGGRKGRERRRKRKGGIGRGRGKKEGVVVIDRKCCRIFYIYLSVVFDILYG